MAKFSTSLRTSMLGVSSFTTLMSDCELRIFAAVTPPATADAAETGTLLATLKDGGTDPLTFGTPAAGVIGKTESETWMTSSVTASGTATYFRLVLIGDAGTATAAPRVQGSIAKIGADMNLGNVVFTSGLPWTLNYFDVELPTQ